MKKADFIKDINEAEKENLAWYTESTLNEMGVRFKTLESLLNSGKLIYENLDDVYVGPKNIRRSVGLIEQAPSGALCERTQRDERM